MTSGESGRLGQPGPSAAGILLNRPGDWPRRPGRACTRARLSRSRVFRVTPLRTWPPAQLRQAEACKDRQDAPVADLHSLTEPYADGMLEVGDDNLVYRETCGNPDGKPALALPRRGATRGSARRLRNGSRPLPR